MTVYIHPAKGVTELPWQIYEERNKLLREVDRLKRRVDALTAINKLTKNRLRKLGSAPKLAVECGEPRS